VDINILICDIVHINIDMRTSLHAILQSLVSPSK
jgi:hypothetical protein